MAILELVGIRISPEHHKILNQLTLNRSAQLGRRVSTGFIIQELLDEHLQLIGQRVLSPDYSGHTSRTEGG